MKMKVIEPYLYVGNRVLFVHNQCAYTGIISSIGNDMYGIVKCNADKCVTDVEGIQRIHDEIFVRKESCKKTGEVHCRPVYHWEDLNRNFNDVVEAYNNLPKKQILLHYAAGPDLWVAPRDDRGYYFVLTNGEICVYTSKVGFMSTKDVNYRVHWFDSHGDKPAEGTYISEAHIKDIFQINEKYLDQYIHAQNHIEHTYLFREVFPKHIDLVYKYENCPQIKLNRNIITSGESLKKDSI